MEDFVEEYVMELLEVFQKKSLVKPQVESSDEAIEKFLKHSTDKLLEELKEKFEMELLTKIFTKN